MNIPYQFDFFPFLMSIVGLDSSLLVTDTSRFTGIYFNQLVQNSSFFIGKLHGDW